MPETAVEHARQHAALAAVVAVVLLHAPHVCLLTFLILITFTELKFFSLSIKLYNINEIIYIYFFDRGAILNLIFYLAIRIIHIKIVFKIL